MIPIKLLSVGITDARNADDRIAVGVSDRRRLFYLLRGARRGQILNGDDSPLSPRRPIGQLHQAAELVRHQRRRTSPFVAYC
jgi:hypothetical protein